MTLREFKELFTSKPCDFSVVIYSTDNRTYKYKETYEILQVFYQDDFCDGFEIDFFHIYNNYVFISLSK